MIVRKSSEQRSEVGRSTVCLTRAVHLSLFTHSIGSLLATSNCHILCPSAEISQKTTQLRVATGTFKCNPHSIYPFARMQSEAQPVTLTLNRPTYSISQKMYATAAYQYLSVSVSYPVYQLSGTIIDYVSLFVQLPSQGKSSTNVRSFQQEKHAISGTCECHHPVTTNCARFLKARYSKSDHMGVRIQQQQEQQKCLNSVDWTCKCEPKTESDASRVTQKDMWPRAALTHICQANGGLSLLEQLNKRTKCAQGIGKTSSYRLLI